jgi:CBS domain-containing protein
MATVFQLLAVKGHTILTIDKTATVFDAISKMVTNNVGALVVNAGLQPCGMLTERDYLRKVALRGRASRTTLVEEIMSKDLISVHPETDIEDCMSLMTQHRIRHLPVFDIGTLVGLVSIGDVVKYLARERQIQIDQLTTYIQRGEMASVTTQFSLR